MLTDQLTTPCGIISVLRNGKPVSFNIVDSEYNSMFTKDNITGQNIEVYPDRCIEIIIDTQELPFGDKMICVLDKNIMDNDGGGEGMVNLIGQHNGFDIALGTLDTEHYEYGWNPKSKTFPSDLHPTKRCLCYTFDYCNGGFKFDIVDDPKLYNDRYYRRCILIKVAWCNSEKPYACNIVSYLTSW
ncbi:hypothetical protein M3N64_08275 [Sporolactobacillus sp. CPB3-1]|uniref:Uncharacterized protein n=1 Tax=Sporolactobacillus mangiferae TaxID=2940498 RepID=A0ABT0MAQ6_9BACL|nr:hypothetical protein [Sporolactobacillus mangiferae]MCL1631944.1 hypothetical protein [Sporolactobacillus mangiferae]